jgi:hypothetical protein
MANGNAFILIKESSKNDQIPLKLKTKWDFTETIFNDAGDIIQEIDVHPTWVELASRLRSQYGDIRNLTLNGVEYILIELELSFVKGEIESVQELQNDISGDYNFTILTITEAISVLSDGTAIDYIVSQQRS